MKYIFLAKIPSYTIKGKKKYMSYQHPTSSYEYKILHLKYFKHLNVNLTLFIDFIICWILNILNVLCDL